MTSKSPSIRVVFMGTPEFAVASLAALNNDPNIDVSAVVTVADKPAGRGQKIRISAVKEYALEHGLPVLQPLKLKDPKFIESLLAFQAEAFCVVAFRMLPEIVWTMPAKGTINLHGSLLPNYRGAAPINRAVMNGETQTGVTTFFIEKEIDTGNVIAQAKMDISLNATAGGVHDEMMILGAELLRKTVLQMAANTAKAIPQEELMDIRQTKPAPKLFRKDCQINWNQHVSEVHNFVRGLSPFPTAWTHMDGKTLNIYKGTLSERPSQKKSPGTLFVENGQLFVATQDFDFELIDVQLEGKKRMPSTDFIRGQQALQSQSIQLQK